MKRIQWERWSAIAICAAAGVVLLWLGAKAIFSFLLPFLFAWVLSLCITPLSDRMAEKLRLPKKLCAVVLLTVALSLVVLLIGASVARLLVELQKLLTRLLENGSFAEVAVEESFDYFEKLTSGIGFLKRMEAGERYAVFRERFNEMVSHLIGNLASALSAGLPKAAGRLISSLPSFLLFTVVTVIAGFYFCMDRHKIEEAILGLLPKTLHDRLPAWKEHFRHFSWRYVRAYLFLLLLTFIELFIGFGILRIEYAFLLALLIAVVDILPVLGVGTVLIPWAVVELLRKNFYLGFGLFILYLAVTVLRQIFEPKLVGKSLGLHPLLTLMSGYVGWKCFGVPGMALGPILALFGKGLLQQFRKEKTASGGKSS